MINTGLLTSTLTHIDRNRREWYQSDWRTCYAGHAVILAGGHWAVADPDHALHYVLTPEDDDLTNDVRVFDAADGWDGEPLHAVTVQARARRVLGLTVEQGVRLFTASNDLPRLYAIVSELCAEPTVLTANRTLVGKHETYAVEYIAHRPGGSIDVVVSATPHDHRALSYLAFRRDAGEWRPLAGWDRDLESAVHRAEHEQRFAGWDSPELADLLGRL